MDLDIQEMQKEFEKSVEDLMKNNLTAKNAVNEILPDFVLKGKSDKIYIDLDKFLMEECSIVNSLREKISQYMNDEDSSLMFIESLQNLLNKCNEVSFCILLIQREFVKIIMEILTNYEYSDEIRNISIEIFYSLLKANPWCLNREDVLFIAKFLKYSYGTKTVNTVLKLLISYGNVDADHASVVTNSAALEHIENILNEEQLTDEIVSNICEVLKFVNHTQTPHSKMLCQTYYVVFHVTNETLDGLIKNLNVFRDNKSTAKKLLITMAKLATRDNLCRRFIHIDGLQLMSEILHFYVDDEGMVYYCYRLLKILAQSDEVRSKMLSFLCADNIVSLLEKYHHSEKINKEMVSFLVSLTMRHADNGKALCESGLVDTIKLCMESHSTSRVHFKRSCWLIYNIASRNRDYSDAFISNGIVDLICQSQAQFKNCHFECKAALIQLGFKIDQVDRMIYDRKQRSEFYRNNDCVPSNISLLLRENSNE